MKKIVLPAVLGLMTLASCNSGGGNDTSKYQGVWQAVAFETPSEDSMTNVQLEAQLKQIEEWKEIPKELKDEMKINNLDSAKAFAINFFNEQKLQMEPQRKEFIEKFKLELNADGNAYRIIDATSDTATWFASTTKAGTNLIILDPFVKGKENVDPRASLTAFEVIYASSDSLRLAIHQPQEIKTFLSLKKSK